MANATISDWGIEHIYESEVLGGDITACIGPREEIVRCRDCKGIRANATPYNRERPHWCVTLGIDLADGNGFCAWAKRRKPCERSEP